LSFLALEIVNPLNFVLGLFKCFLNPMCLPPSFLEGLSCGTSCLNPTPLVLPDHLIPFVDNYPTDSFYYKNLIGTFPVDIAFGTKAFSSSCRLNIRPACMARNGSAFLLFIELSLTTDQDMSRNHGWRTLQDGTLKLFN
jgi:hypothetical protein